MSPRSLVLSAEAGTTSDFEALVKAGYAALTAAGFTVRIRALHRSVRGFLSTNRPRSDFEPWLISYADPTGETAVRNVMGGAR